METTTRRKYLDMVTEHADDLHIRKYVVYGDTVDTKLYREATGTSKTQIKQAEIEDMFKKGAVVIKVGAKYYTPLVLNGNKVSTIDLVSSTVTITEWLTEATV